MRYEAWQTRQLLPPLGEVTVYLQHEYYGPMPSRDELTRGAIEGMLETLGDPYARLIEPQNNVSAVDIFTGKYGDVGADVVWDEGWRLVPYPTGPAALAGVQSGDRLLSLDGRTVQALSRADIETALSGAEGTPVTLELERNGERFTLTVVRAEVPHPSVSAYLLTPEVGYIRVARITETTAEECRAALQAWTGLRGVVLDLRGNPGGVVSEVPAMAALFLPRESVVYYEVRRSGAQPVVVSADEDPFTGQLVVLIDGHTASAAEVISAAVQDHGRGVLIGQSSAGKAHMQIAYPLANGWTVVLTNAAWESPSRRSLEGKGVQPDILIAPESGPVDSALEGAVRLISGKP